MIKANLVHLISVYLLTILVLTSCKRPPFNFAYEDWDHLSIDDDILWQYVPGLERALNVQIDSIQLYNIDHFTSAQVKGMPNFNYNVSFVMNKTNKSKQHRLLPLEKVKMPQDNSNCLSLFEINPWVKLFNVTLFHCT